MSKLVWGCSASYSASEFQQQTAPCLENGRKRQYQACLHLSNSKLILCTCVVFAFHGSCYVWIQSAFSSLWTIINRTPCHHDSRTAWAAVWDTGQRSCRGPALSVWSSQGLGSPDLVSSVLKATYSFQHVWVERMTEKTPGAEPTAKPLFGRQREGGVLTHPWNISVLPQQKLVWATKTTKMTSWWWNGCSTCF